MALFTEEETAVIKREYDFKERLSDSALSETSSVFTVHNLNTTENNDDDMSKSDILAPFNTNENDTMENDTMENDTMENIEPLIVSRRIIKFSPKLREFNRRYERDNNSNIDNGIYVQSLSSNNSPRAFSTRSTSSNTMQSSYTQIDKQIIEKMVKMGFDNSFVKSSLNSDSHNSATTCYYLMLG